MGLSCTKSNKHKKTNPSLHHESVENRADILHSVNAILEIYNKPESGSKKRAYPKEDTDYTSEEQLFTASQSDIFQKTRAHKTEPKVCENKQFKNPVRTLHDNYKYELIKSVSTSAKLRNTKCETIEKHKYLKNSYMNSSISENEQSDEVLINDVYDNEMLNISGNYNYTKNEAIMNTSIVNGNNRSIDIETLENKVDQLLREQLLLSSQIIRHQEHLTPAYFTLSEDRACLCNMVTINDSKSSVFPEPYKPNLQINLEEKPLNWEIRMDNKDKNKTLLTTSDKYTDCSSIAELKSNLGSFLDELECPIKKFKEQSCMCSLPYQSKEFKKFADIKPNPRSIETLKEISHSKYSSSVLLMPPKSYTGLPLLQWDSVLPKLFQIPSNKVLYVVEVKKSNSKPNKVASDKKVMQRRQLHLQAEDEINSASTETLGFLNLEILLNEKNGRNLIKRRSTEKLVRASPLSNNQDPSLKIVKLLEKRFKRRFKTLNQLLQEQPKVMILFLTSGYLRDPGVIIKPVEAPISYKQFTDFLASGL